MRESLKQLLFAGNIGLSPPISSQFTLLQPKIEKITKTPTTGVQGHSRSSMLTLLRISPPLLVIISSMSVPIWNLLSNYQNLCPKCTYRLRRDAGLSFGGGSWMGLWTPKTIWIIFGTPCWSWSYG